jgi:hypothetical protein
LGHGELRGALVVVIEFTGVARSYHLGKAIVRQFPDAELLEIDPLNVRKEALWSVGARARELCSEITGRAPADVVIVGYCSAAILCGHVARQLAESGISVSGTALLDPVIVNDELIVSALQDIEVSLDCGSRIRDAMPPASSALFDSAKAEELLRILADEYAAVHLPSGARIKSMVEFLADRYIAWVSFLCSTAWDKRPLWHPGKLTVFGSADGLAPGEYTKIFRADELMLYSAHGRPCLSVPDCATDFYAWLEEFIKD